MVGSDWIAGSTASARRALALNLVVWIGDAVAGAPHSCTCAGMTGARPPLAIPRTGSAYNRFGHRWPLWSPVRLRAAGLLRCFDRRALAALAVACVAAP